MNDYCVTTRDAEFSVTTEEKELIQDLPNDEKIEDRFPFDDWQRNKSEVFKIGSQSECQEYIDNINPKIVKFFKIDNLNSGK